ncbi:MAG: hypothetical protein Q8807_02920 ['Waltheria sp.' little leaf phytoplasma]|nr:hypothetical protein ['Waltheria sp.' little leaf phytoplasma]
MVENELKDQVADIDAADINNELAVVEYVDDLYKFYKSSEVCFVLILYLFFLYLLHLAPISFYSLLENLGAE